jgi:hypothetical protein
MRSLTASRVLIALGTLIAMLAILAVWISRQALETDQWTKTSSELLEQPAVQVAVAGYLVDQLYANVDVQGEIRKALPARADALAGPAAGALRRGAEDVAKRALSSPRVQAAWEDANREAHKVLVAIILHNGGKVVDTANGVVRLDLRALLEEIAQRTGIGDKIVDKLPASAASLEIVRSDELGTVQTGARLLKPLAAVLVLLSLACFGGAIALARGRRRQMVRAAGLGFIFAGATALVVRQIAGGTVVDQLASTAAVRPAIEDVWTVGTSFLVGVATATIAYGALAVIGAWLAGPTRIAVQVRTALAPYLADARITYGVVAAVVLLVLVWGPTEATRRLLPALVLVILLVIGVEALRRQVRREFPDATRGPSGPPGEPPAGDGAEAPEKHVMAWSVSSPEPDPRTGDAPAPTKSP